MQTPKQAIEQIIGHAKSGKYTDRDGGEFYLMDAENVDQMADAILTALADPRNMLEE